MKSNNAINAKLSTLILKTTIVTMAIFVTVFCVFVLPAIYREWPIELPAYAQWHYLLIFVILAAAILFFIAAVQIFSLLNLIGGNKAFTKASVSAMRRVKYCGYIVSALCTSALPLIFLLAESDDAPGLILMYGFIFIGIPLIIGIFSGVAQTLFQSAINLKSENDLTV